MEAMASGSNEATQRRSDGGATLSWLDRLLKHIDHNRYTYLANGIGLALVIAAIVMAGCQFKATSPFTDQPATSAELSAQFEAWSREQVREAEAQRREREVTLKQLTGEYETHVQQLADAGAISAQALQDAIATKQAQFDLANAEIARKQELAQAVLDTVMSLPVVSSNPALVPMLATGGGLWAILRAFGLKADNRRKDEQIAARSAALKQGGEIGGQGGPSS